VPSDCRLPKDPFLVLIRIAGEATANARPTHVDARIQCALNPLGYCSVEDCVQILHLLVELVLDVALHYQSFLIGFILMRIHCSPLGQLQGLIE